MFAFLSKHNRRLGDEIEVQEVLLDKLASDRAEEELSERKMELPLSQAILRILYVSFLLIAAVVLGKVFYLQVVENEEIKEAAAANAIRNIPLAPDRGVIYDSSFTQLAFNKPSFDLICDNLLLPSSSREKENIVRKAADLLGLPFEEVREGVQGSVSPRILVKENLSHEELVVFESQSGEFPGCGVVENVRREYADGALYAHIIGYMAKISASEFQELEGYSVTDQVGKTGVEKEYEEELRGNPGKIVMERDARGTIVGEKERVETEQGTSLVLWLDAQLQERLTRALELSFQSTGTSKGAAVALDPQTGGVKALVSLPSFDANLFSGGISSKDWASFINNPLRPLFNRAISGIGYPTGSVIKPFVGAAALAEGVIEETTRIFAPLEICLENIYTNQDECFRDWEFHGTSDIKRAIAESVNTFFYIVGGGFEGFEGLGPYKIKEYIEKFGWGEPTGVDLPGEGKGILPVFDSNWRLGDTYHLSIGQGPFAVTPLQVASAFGAVANGGTLFEPMAAKLLVDGDRNTTKTFEPRVAAEQVLDKDVLQIIQRGMEQTVTAGSATGWLDSLPVSVAAKTGTAQTGKKTADGKDYLYSWTVAYAPASEPEIVLVVVVEDVIEGRAGSLPVAKDVFQWYFNR